MQIFRLTFWILIFVLLTGCSSTPPQPLLSETLTIQTVNSLHESPPTASISPSLYPQEIQTRQTETIAHKPTQVLPTVGITSAPPANKFHIQTQCPDEKLGIHEIPNLPGTLVFSSDNRLRKKDLLSPDPGRDSMISFWHPQSDRISFYNLEEDHEYYYYAESPSKENLAFTEGKTATISYDLFVVDQQGNELGRSVVPDDWTFFNWVSKDQLLIQKFVGNEKFNLVAIKLADKAQQDLTTNFPDLYLMELYWDWGSQILFNPDATLVIYPVRQHNPEQLYTVLWNVRENKEVTRITSGHWARWAPDGSRFLLVTSIEDYIFETQNELLFITSSGEPFRASFFSEYYEEFWIEAPVWSPDSRYIAFWFSTTRYPFDKAILVVFDTKTLTANLLCKEISPRPFRFGDPYDLGYAYIRVNSSIPIWSPDSHYLLIEDYYDSVSNAYVYDLRNNTITKIATQARPVGWLK